MFNDTYTMDSLTHIINSNHLGTPFLVALSILGGFALILKIRDHFAESPDPKLTYATNKQLNIINNHLKQIHYETQKDIKELRQEIKNDHRDSSTTYRADLQNTSQILRQTLQDTAALQAKVQMLSLRLSELSIKCDKLQLKSK